MRGYNLRMIYNTLQAMGLVRSKRQYSRDYLGRGWSYLREFEQRDRDDVRVSATTITTLQIRLRAVARYVPPTIAAEINQVIAAIERDSRIADMLGYRGRSL